MKAKYVYTILIGYIIVLTCMFRQQMIDTAKYKNLYNKELQNVTAYQLSNSDLEKEIRQYQMSINDLMSSKDSIDKKLMQVAEELKIKTKSIESLQYREKVIYKSDTIHTTDTIFKPEVHIDTLLSDSWYKMNIKLDYPSSIIVSPQFNSEEYVIVNTKKEYYKTPSKLFFIRWFQRKYTVVEVNVEEKSPYIINKQSKFIKVLK